jgi:hypothetical protein
MKTRAGPRTLYKPDEEAWLESPFDEYLALVSDKPREFAAHKRFRDERTEKFLDKFKPQLIDEHRGMELTPLTDIGKWRVVSGLDFSPVVLTDCRGR